VSAGPTTSRDRLLARSVRREVVAVDVPGEGLRVRKAFLARTGPRRVREAVKAAFGRAASQREARALRAMEVAGVAAPRLVGESSSGFGTRRLEQTFVTGEPLVGLLADAARRRVVLPQVGAELYRAHEAGWIHGDLHEENVLVDECGAFLIDWQRARPIGGDASARLEDVARFEHSMWLHDVPLGDRIRFRRAALGLGEGRSGAADRAELRSVGAAVCARARDFARTRTRRMMRAEDGRAPVRLAGLRGLRLPTLDDAALRTLLDAHARLDATSGGDVKEPIGRFVRRGGETVLKRDHRSVLTAVALGDRSFVVKEVRKAGLRRRLADAFRGSPARCGFRAGHGLLLRGIGTAVPYAYVERRRLGLPVASWLVLEDLRGLWPVAEPATNEAPDLTRERSRPGSDSVADALARLMVRLHSADVCHGDLQAIHVLLRRSETGGERVEPLLIDCDAVRFDAKLGDAERIADFAGLYASIPERLLSPEARRRLFERVALRCPFRSPRDEVCQQLEWARAQSERPGVASGAQS